MPRFIPSIPDSFNGSPGEETVFFALRQLDAQFTVFHSLSWVGISIRTQGEADFIILHPKFGILIIEVKSGGIQYKDGIWYQTNTNNNFTKVISPFMQAQRSRFEIQERLECRVKATVLICHAVWFPSIVLNNNSLPPESPREIILDETSLDDPSIAIIAVFDYWLSKLRRHTNLNDAQFEGIVNLLCPYLNIVPKLGSIINDAEKQYFRLTNNQIAVLNFLVEQKTASIKGLAGTGKTVLAVEKARMLSESGTNVLFLCYNSFLKDWLRRTNMIPNIVFHNVHSLAFECIKDSTMPLDSAEKNLVCFINENQDSWAFNHVVVDEGQDLSEDLLSSLGNIMHRNSGCFYVFYDNNQALHREQTPEWLEKSECRLVLYKNCRNTNEIFTTACSILNVDSATAVNDIHGITPYGHFYETEKQFISIVSNFVKHSIDAGLSTEDIVILTAGSTEKSWLKYTLLVAGCELSSVVYADRILFTTIRKFKGLEAKAILIIDISIRDLWEEDFRRLVYVGSSRAKHILQLAILQDVKSADDYDITFKKIFGIRNLPKNSNGLGRALHMKVDSR